MPDLTVTVALPADPSSSTADVAARVRELWVFDLVRLGRMTRVRAAHTLGMTLDDFLARAAEHGVASIDYGPDDFARELDAIP